MEIKVTVGIDSDPFQTRPCDLLPAVIQGTCLEGKDPQDSTMRTFGAWKWEWTGINAETWLVDYNTVVGRLQRLYADDRIRGAVHGPNTDKVQLMLAEQVTNG